MKTDPAVSHRRARSTTATAWSPGPVLPEHQRPGAVKARRSEIHGRGLFSGIDLPGRRKLGEISGEVVDRLVARRAIRRDPVIYFVTLDRKHALDCRLGNDFKHLNHRCEPNCYLRVRGWAVEVYTLRPIAKGEELTVDYGVTPHPGGMPCRCGAEGCRRRL